MIVTEPADEQSGLLLSVQRRRRQRVTNWPNAELHGQFHLNQPASLHAPVLPRQFGVLSSR
jgi:hypothetical protein